MRFKRFLRIFSLTMLPLAVPLLPAQTWSTLTNSPPGGVELCLLLTDGGVMCQGGSNWYKLTPDLNGRYLNGTWSGLSSFPAPYVPGAFASAVLADGRVVVVGGEYNGGNFALSNQGAIYDPMANTWTMLPLPPSTGANHFQCIGDAPATVLADGRLLIGSKLYQDLAVLDPATLTWSLVSASGKTDAINSEEGWTLLPDGSVLTVDVQHAPASERFLLTAKAAGVWVPSGNTVVDLHTPTTSQPLTAPGCPEYFPPGEIGPALLRPDGTVFAIGADGFTAIYTPPPAGSTAAGTWAQGPSLPAHLDVEDGPAASLPSGRVLFGGSPGATGTGLQYFEFDGRSLLSVPAPDNAGRDATEITSLLGLPTGQVLFIDQTNTVQIYTPASAPTYQPAWAPAISSVPASVSNGHTYPISGTQFNGLNQGTSFGDERQNATNYPLVRIVNNATGHVFYARTHGHSSMGVATGPTIVSTNFDVPPGIEIGASIIQVVANGIPSPPLAITVSNTNRLTSTAVASSPSPAVVGQLVTFTSTTSSSAGVPVGSVTFSENSTVWASNVSVDPAGNASFSTTALAAGSHTITATFTGAAGWSNSVGTAAPEVVNASATTTTTTATSSPNPASAGQTVTFTSSTSSSGGAPVGTVTFTEGSTVLASNIAVDGSGRASFNTSALSPGSHTITATFTGTAAWGNSSGNAAPEVVNAPPALTVSSPAPNAVVSGLVTVAGTASDPRGITSVTIGNGVTTFGTASGTTQWTYQLNTNSLSNGPLTLSVVATDAGGLQTTVMLPLTVSNGWVPGQAAYSTALQGPVCASASPACDSGSLLNGRGTISGGIEAHQPNTINGTCPDGLAGSYHIDESNDRIRVFTLDGQPMATGKAVEIDATVWASTSFVGDSLDLYYSSNANAPNWIYIATLKPTRAGQAVLSSTYALPAGSLQAVRANFHYGRTSGACTTGDYDDHDDLAFAVVSAAPSAPNAPAGVQLTSPTTNSLQLSWSASTGGINATGYRVDVSTNSGFTSFVTGYQNLDAGAVLGLKISGLQPGITYYALVRAYDSAGDVSQNSATAFASTTSQPLLAPVITSSSSASGTVGAPFGYSIVATNSPTGFNASGLPASLTVNTMTGQITGTPTSAGVFNITLQATNTTGTGSAPLTLTIGPASQPQAPTAAFVATPVTGQRFTVTFDASGSTGGNLNYGWNFGDHSAGYGPVNTHTFPSAGSYSVNLTVSNGLGYDRAKQVVTVN